MPTTARWALRYPALTDTADVPRDIGNLAADLDGVAFDDQGAFSARPVSTVGSPGKRGRYYWATDQGLLYRDNGTGWDTINPSQAVDAAANVGSLRTLGTGALQAAAGNDARLSDQRTPLDGSVTTPKIAPALLPSQGAANSTEALRAIGAGSGQVVAGNDARLTDQRTPLDASVTAAKVNNALKPSQGAAAGTEALRALGTTGSTAAAGNDARLSDQRTPADASVTGPKLSADLKGEWRVAGVLAQSLNGVLGINITGDNAWHTVGYMAINVPNVPAGLTRQWRLTVFGQNNNASTMQILIRDFYRPTTSNTGGPTPSGVFFYSVTLVGDLYAATLNESTWTPFEATATTSTFFITQIMLSYRYV